MSSKPERLPFEPKKKQKVTQKKSDLGSNQAAQTEPTKTVTKPKITKTPTTPERITRQKDSPRNSAASNGAGRKNEIPQVVSNRMVSRMAILSGTPLLMALFTFIGSYFILVNEIFPLPNQAVVFVSMGWFGLSVLGLSYGILSASWEEDQPGSWLGWQEFNTNFRRMKQAWTAPKSKN